MNMSKYPCKPAWTSKEFPFLTNKSYATFDTLESDGSFLEIFEDTIHHQDGAVVHEVCMVSRKLLVHGEISRR